MRTRCSSRRRGMTLIIVQWLSLMVFVFAMTVSATGGFTARTTANWDARNRAYYAAYSSMELELARLEAEPAGQPSLQMVTEEELELLEVDEEPISIDPSGEFYFSTAVVLDECSLIDVNHATRGMLLSVPGMTEELADAIITWRTPQRGGVEEDPEHGDPEIDPETGLPIYPPLHRPFQSVDELLMVPGMTPELLYGSAAYRGGMTPVQRLRLYAMDRTDEFGFGGGVLDDVALVHYLTVSGLARDMGSDGNLRITVPRRQNNRQRQQIERNLRQRLQGTLGRQDVNRAVSAVTEDDPPASFQQLWSRVNNNRRIMGALADVLALPGRTGQGQAEAEEFAAAPPSLWPVASGTAFMFQDPDQDPDQDPELPENIFGVPQEAAPQAQRALRGVVNINTAPFEVLLALPGIDEQTAEDIMMRRVEEPFRSRGELLQLEGINASRFNNLISRVTVFSDSFRVFTVGRSRHRDVAVHLTARIDRTSGRAVITHFRQDN